VKPSGQTPGGREPRRNRRLEGLCTRHGLSVGQAAKLTTILTVLANDERAPTSVRDPALAVDVHLADSLAALELESLREARVIADIGAGAGFPGLPLAVALPMVEVRLVDSQARKCDFIAGLCTALAIDNTKVFQTRVEDWIDGHDAHDVVLARALAAQPVVLEYAAPLLRLGGMLVDWRGVRKADEEQAAAVAAAALGLERVEIVHVEPYPGAREHHLHLYRKLAATPERFPRRAGMARKRPLGV
jgi:16S rRNA (guanine527-N7)-methyltransferase